MLDSFAAFLLQTSELSSLKMLAIGADLRPVSGMVAAVPAKADVEMFVRRPSPSKSGSLALERAFAC